LSNETLAKPVHLFDIEPRARYGFGTQGMNYHLFGDKFIEVPNEPEALVVNYFLAADAAAPAKITLTDPGGRALRTINDGPAKRGLNRVLVSLTAGGRAGGGGGGGAGAAGGRGRGAGASVGTAPLEVGEYPSPSKWRERR
jgi:hypothetical protein